MFCSLALAEWKARWELIDIYNDIQDQWAYLPHFGLVPDMNHHWGPLRDALRNYLRLTM